MAIHPILSERRQHSRDGILGRVKNITYSVLRSVRFAWKSSVTVTVSCGARVAGDAVLTAEGQQQAQKGRGASMSANLVIVHSNPRPNRKRNYPRTWLVYSQGQELQVQVEHDRDYRPHVLRKGAA